MLYFISHVHFLLLLVTMQNEKKTNQKKRKTRDYLQHPLGALIKWINVGRADTLTKPIVDYVNTASVKIRTTLPLNPKPNEMSNQCR